MDEIKITVAVPVYNMKPLIPRALESLLTQEYHNYEILLIDDGSTDGSAELCDEYAAKHDRIRVIHKENGGLSTARNAGIDAAKGDYIVFPDPDDWVEKDYLQTFCALRQESNADVVICGHFVDTDTTSVLHNPTGKQELLDRQRALKMLVKSKYFCGFATTKLLNLAQIRAAGLRFDPSHGMAQDLAFMIKLFAQCDTFCYAPQRATYHYYQSPAGVTNGGLSARKVSGLKTFADMADFCRTDAPIIYDDVLATLANLAVTLSHNYAQGHCKNPQWKKTIRDSIRGNYSALRKSDHSLSRKVFALLSLVSFRLSYDVKRFLSGKNGK